VVAGVVLIVLLPVCVGPALKKLRRVLGVRFVDEKAGGAGEIERVGAAGVVGRNHGRDSRRGESRLGELRYLAFTRITQCGHAVCSGRIFVMPVDAAEARPVSQLIGDPGGAIAWVR
jgi:hypothetical protein